MALTATGRVTIGTALFFTREIVAAGHGMAGHFAPRRRISGPYTLSVRIKHAWKAFNNMTGARQLLRKAEPADAPAVQSLFAVRSHSDEATDNDAQCPDLANPRRKMWLAFDGDRAVGMTGVQERQVLARDQECRIAYWTGLFVDPSYRGRFIYPQLVLAMFAGLRDSGTHYIYAAIRRQQVAEAHMKMGFRKVGEMAVLAKPLRPALLWAKYKRVLRTDEGHWLIRALCGALDDVFGLGIRLQGPHFRKPAAEIPWTSGSLSDVAALCARSTAGYTAQSWTEDALRARYAAGDAGYRLLGVWAQDQLLAVAIVRVVDRPEGIRAAVIMDLFHEPGAVYAAKSALASVERLALAAGCDVVLFLDGIPPCDARIARRRGYLKSPERYALLMWYDKKADPGLLPQDIRSWRFAFGDHDTF